MLTSETSYEPVWREVEPGGFLLEYASVPSTQDVARECVNRGDRSILGVRADCQSEGRGRRGARWIAPAGACLLVTYIVRPERALDSSHLAFAAGVGVSEAIASLTGLTPALKWPNDVLLGGRKVAGILIETVGIFALVGIGLNVNISDFPPALADSATSLLCETGIEWSIAELEGIVRHRVFALVDTPWDEVLRRWKSRDDTAGRRYATVIDGAEVTGEAVGVDMDGALLLKLANGTTAAVLSATSI